MVFCSRITFLSALLVVAGRSLSQDWTVYDMSNTPLPSTTVTAIVEDQVGGLWVGTDWGLCHFDGDAQWEVYQVDNSGLPWNAISALTMGDNGELWVGTVAGGLARLENGTWTVYTPDDSGFPSLGVRDLFFDHRGWLWAPTASGLTCYTGDEWRVYNDSPQSYAGAILNTGNTNSVAVRGDGLVCLGTFNGGLHYITNDNVVSYLTTFQNGFFDNTATDVLFDPVNGDRWVATPAGGMLRQQGPPGGGSWFQWNSSINFPSNAMECATMDQQRRVWAGTQTSGVVRIDVDGSFIQLASFNSDLPDDEVNAILAAADGSIWMGTVYGGLVRYRETVGLPDSFRSVSTKVRPNPVSQGFVTVTTNDPNGYWNWALLDASGREVNSGRGSGTSFPISTDGYPSGLYHLRIGQDRFVEDHKLLVF